MDEAELKEAYRLFWLVKGHMNCSDETALSSADGYFKRLWNNNERSEYGMEGFEEAYSKKKLI
jgi:hypothetical protein